VVQKTLVLESIVNMVNAQTENVSAKKVSLDLHVNIKIHVSEKPVLIEVNAKSQINIPTNVVAIKDILELIVKMLLLALLKDIK